MSLSTRTWRLAGASSVEPLAPATRAAAIAEQQLDVIWRMARRLGVPDSDIEDVAQEVLIRPCRARATRAPSARATRSRTWSARASWRGSRARSTK
jgi:DNA-directed RNA polymerase specialized sigma24 family protein